MLRRVAPAQFFRHYTSLDSWVVELAKTMNRTKVLILGAAGRDFHNFNVVFRNNPQYEVVAFTATQIPNIEGRRYPPALAGPLYPDGIPILSEEELPALIRSHEIDEVIFAYSDVSHEYVMHKASLVIATGASFRLLGPQSTMLSSKKPVISICAVRTGAGKSPVTRYVASFLTQAGRRVVVIRHPMPYGDLAKQVVQRFAGIEDLQRANCTIEEMEEYEPHIQQGRIVYAGVDYEAILRQAENEADVILWDGGNNDLPFFVPDVEIVLVDPHRAGDESRYFPGESNLLRAQVVVLTKLDTAPEEKIAAARAAIAAMNPDAVLVNTAMPIIVDNSERIRGARVLVVEDGPTLTHGGMRFGAGVLASKKFGASTLIDPRPAAVGSIKGTFDAYPQIGPLLPAMGYGAQQTHELEETIQRVECDVVVIATPVDLRRVIHITQPTCRVRYEVADMGSPPLRDIVMNLLTRVAMHD